MKKQNILALTTCALGTIAFAGMPAINHTLVICQFHHLGAGDIVVVEQSDGSSTTNYANCARAIDISVPPTGHTEITATTPSERASNEVVYLITTTNS